MKVMVEWTETARYKQVLDVDEDEEVDIDDDEAIEGLICDQADLDKAFVAVEGRDITRTVMIT